MTQAQRQRRKNKRRHSHGENGRSDKLEKELLHRGSNPAHRPQNASPRNAPPKELDAEALTRIGQICTHPCYSQLHWGARAKMEAKRASEITEVTLHRIERELRRLGNGGSLWKEDAWDLIKDRPMAEEIAFLKVLLNRGTDGRVKRMHAKRHPLYARMSLKAKAQIEQGSCMGLVAALLDVLGFGHQLVLPEDHNAAVTALAEHAG